MGLGCLHMKKLMESKPLRPISGQQSLKPISGSKMFTSENSIFMCRSWSSQSDVFMFLQYGHFQIFLLLALELVNPAIRAEVLVFVCLS